MTDGTFSAKSLSHPRVEALHMYRSWTSYENLRGEFFLVERAEASSELKRAYAVFDQIWWETDPEVLRGLDKDGARDEFTQ